MASLVVQVSNLATAVANYLRDSVVPRLIPVGGTTGNRLVKASATAYDVEWAIDKLVQYKLAMGTTPKRGHHGLEFTITDVDVVAGSKIVAWYQPIEDLAAKEHEDESEFDNLDILVLPSSIVAGSFKIRVQTRNNAPISGQKTLLYSVRN